MTIKKASSFIDLIDMEILDPNRESSNTAEAVLDIGEHHSQFNNVLHGGVLYSVADTLGGFLIWKNVPLENLVTTIEMKMNYLAAVSINGSIKAIASIKHLGKRTGVVTVDLYHISDLKEKLVATSVGTYQIINKSKNNAS